MNNMNSTDAYFCSTKRGSSANFKQCKNCQYYKYKNYGNIHTTCCDIDLIADHMYADLIGSYNTIESLKVTKVNYEKEIEDLNKEIRRLKLQLPIDPKECCTSTINELTIKSDVSLNDLLNLPNVESVSIYLNKKEE